MTLLASSSRRKSLKKTPRRTRYTHNYVAIEPTKSLLPSSQIFRSYPGHNQGRKNTAIEPQTVNPDECAQSSPILTVACSIKENIGKLSPVSAILVQPVSSTVQIVPWLTALATAVTNGCVSVLLITSAVKLGSNLFCRHLLIHPRAASPSHIIEFLNLLRSTSHLFQMSLSSSLPAIHLTPT